MIEKSYGGQNRKYRFVHFPQTFSYLFVYQKLIARGKNYNCTMKTTKMTKKTIISKTEINLANWIRFDTVFAQSSKPQCCAAFF